jgi:hypothetical protein
MSNPIKTSVHESRVKSLNERPFNKHERRANRYFPLRIAGDIWKTSERGEAVSKRRNAQYDSIRGFNRLGFGLNDNFGPDDSFQTKENLKSTHDQDHYTAR